jgi:hypothetical protein
MGFERVLWVRIMEEEISDHSTNFSGFVLLGRCLPATYCAIYYGFKMMKQEQGLLIQQKKIYGCSRV